MKSLLFLCSLVLLYNSPNNFSPQVPVVNSEINDYNPYLKLAEIKNSMDMSIDDYVNNIVEKVQVDPSHVIQKAKEKDSWLYKSFIHDSKYMTRMHKMHVKINNQFNDEQLVSQAYYNELKVNFPYYAELLPILSSPGQNVE
jgi:hypothetical protein